MNNLATFIEQHVLAARRDVRREVSIEHVAAGIEHSTVRLARLLPAEGATPSVEVQQQEEMLRLADHLALLPEDYRQVLVLRNLQELPFDEIAKRMDRSAPATRMLWLRAIEKLKVVYREGATDAE